ncbi:MAG: DUF5693 family protein, partial [Armatimonadota bacterium]|nr:DUF5693 family protein [Armatimonadota bacterium]MDW8144563.1 DUF5693 family protein [Armatimonadota bacterium]
RKSFSQQFGWQLPEPQKTQLGWQVHLPSPEILNSPVYVGLDKNLAEAAKKAKIATVARLPNPVGLTENGINFWLDEVKSVGAFAILFEGEEVFGYRTLLPKFAEAVKQTDQQLGFLELTTQKGDKALSSLLPEKVIRVHSVSAREIVNFSQPELVDRFVRAVNERNIRLCYIRFPFHLKGEPLTIASDYLSNLRAELEHKGFKIGIPSPMQQVSAPIWLWALICLGAVVTGVAFLCLFFPLSASQQFGLTVFGLVLGLAIFAI